MVSLLNLPILSGSVRSGFEYGANYLVEYEPHSPWYETALTIAASALTRGMRTDFHTFMHIPDEVRGALVRLGLDVNRLEKEEIFRLSDSYTVTTGLRSAELLGKVSARERYWNISLDLREWAKGAVEEMKNDLPEIERRRLHLDDNTSVLLQYNDEKTFIDHWRTHEIPYARRFEVATFHAFVTGVASESFYRQFESFCDGIIDFTSREEGGQLQHYFRVRTMRGKACDSRWRRLIVSDNGDVKSDPKPAGFSELGLGGWIKGRRI